MPEPAVPGWQLEMLRSVNEVVALAVGEGLDDVAEVTVHHNQSPVDRRENLVRDDDPGKVPCSGLSLPTCQMTRWFCHWFLTLLWGEKLTQTQISPPEKGTGT